MPAISLVVCVYRERELLQRLLDECKGLFDDLVVVHDGPENEERGVEGAGPSAIDYSRFPVESATPDEYRPHDISAPGSIQELVVQHNGQYFQGPRSFQQEPHWPFAWCQAKHDWILRLDADEIPSVRLKEWLATFRQTPPEDENTAGFTCIWPLWDGRKIVTKNWPDGRIFLFNKRRVRFFGMVEQVPIPDSSFTALPFVLEHRPARKSYGLRNLVVRKQAFDWRRVIAASLLNHPTDLPRWRWSDPTWPPVWEAIRERPLRTAFRRLIGWPIRTSQAMKRAEGHIALSAAISGGVHHALIAIAFWRVSRRRSGPVI